MTCHLVKEEALLILKRKMGHCRTQPVRYLVDYSSAWALQGDGDALYSYFGLNVMDSRSFEDNAAERFFVKCARSVARTSVTDDLSKSIRTIHLTMTHKSDAEYSWDVVVTLNWPQQLRDLDWITPTRFVIIYETPLPRMNIAGNIKNPSDLAKWSLGNIPRDTGLSDPTGSGAEVFVRSLEEEAFEKHVEGLKWY
jgi:hypothetical protein